MKSRPVVINNRIINTVEQLACFLKSGDIFRKLRGNTQYMFKELIADQKLVICENMDTHASEEIYCNSPVYRLMIL